MVGGYFCNPRCLRVNSLIIMKQAFSVLLCLISPSTQGIKAMTSLMKILLSRFLNEKSKLRRGRSAVPKQDSNKNLTNYSPIHMHFFNFLPYPKIEFGAQMDVCVL